MTLTFYGLKSCDTCKKAQKSLMASGRDLDIRDVRADGAPEAALTAWIAEHGTDALINRRSTTWRGLDDAARAKAETPEGAVALLLQHPTLMKRPVIVDGDRTYVGWSKDVEAALL